MARAWCKVTVEIPREHGDAVANFLMEHGAPGLESEEQVDKTRLTAYFSIQPPIDALRRYCTAIGCSPSSPDGVHIQVQAIATEDWAENWKRHFKPQIVGDQLYICPPWATTPPPGRLAIIIDPGMAFGTGHHPTTRGCLQLIEWAARHRHILQAVDVGTGSGILAIALAKLGVCQVWAIDTDPNAGPIALANARRNEVDGCIRVAPSLEASPAMFDLVVANLFANLLQEQASWLTRRLRSDGLIICSGFELADEERVRNAYSALGLTVWKRYEEACWVTLALGRGSA